MKNFDEFWVDAGIAALASGTKSPGAYDFGSPDGVLMVDEEASWNGQSREAHILMSLESRNPELKRKANQENSDDKSD